MDPLFRKADDISVESLKNAPIDPSVNKPETLPTAIRAADEPGLEPVLPPRTPIQCRDCHRPMTPLGKIPFIVEGGNFFLQMVAKFTDRDAASLTQCDIDVFRCPQCLRLELYDLNRALHDPDIRVP